MKRKILLLDLLILLGLLSNINAQNKFNAYLDNFKTVNLPFFVPFTISNSIQLPITTVKKFISNEKKDLYYHWYAECMEPPYNVTDSGISNFNYTSILKFSFNNYIATINRMYSDDTASISLINYDKSGNRIDKFQIGYYVFEQKLCYSYFDSNLNVYLIECNSLYPKNKTKINIIKYHIDKNTGKVIYDRIVIQNLITDYDIYDYLDNKTKDVILKLISEN